MSRHKTSWFHLLSVELYARGETLDDVIAIDGGFVGTEGAPFTAWTAKYVYFPTEYDGAEGVRSVPRNPCEEETRHV